MPMPMLRPLSAKLNVSGTGGSALSPQHIAMNLLARREHSLLELKLKLTARDIDADQVDAVVADLAARDLVSDARFAESFTQARMRRGQGPVRIRQELRQRGVDAATADNCLAARAGEWESLVVSVRHKKFGESLPEEFKDKAKQMRFLEYRGFTAEQINAAFEKVSAEHER